MYTKHIPHCAASRCVGNCSSKKRHFFRFPRERDRWLQWIQACKRLDLEAKGPDYAHRNMRLCHLHFEKKWYNMNKIRARLHADAVPTIFTDLSFYNESTAIDKVQIRNLEIEGISQYIKHERRNSYISSNISETSMRLSDSSQRKDLHMKTTELSTLREVIRRIRMKKKLKQTRSALEEELKQYESLRKLGRKLFPTNFGQLLSAQIDAEMKSELYETRSRF